MLAAQVGTSEFLWLLYMVALVWTITDCVRRKEHPFWIVIVLLFPFAGPLLYWTWTRNWIGRLARAGAGGHFGRSDSDGEWDLAGEGTPAALQRRGSQLVRNGRYEEAVQVLENVLEREGPKAPNDLRYDIALAYKALGRHRDARDQLSLIVGDDPNFRAGQAFLELADCHVRMNDQNRARGLFEQLLRVVRFPEARYRYGMLLDHAGETAAATEQMRLLLAELDGAPEFHRRNNRRFARLARKYLKSQ